MTTNGDVIILAALIIVCVAQTATLYLQWLQWKRQR